MHTFRNILRGKNQIYFHTCFQTLHIFLGFGHFLGGTIWYNTIWLYTYIYVYIYICICILRQVSLNVRWDFRDTSFNCSFSSSRNIRLTSALEVFKIVQVSETYIVYMQKHGDCSCVMLIHARVFQRAIWVNYACVIDSMYIYNIYRQPMNIYKHAYIYTFKSTPIHVVRIGL